MPLCTIFISSAGAMQEFCFRIRPLQKENGPSLNSYVYDWTRTADCSLEFRFLGAKIVVFLDIC